MTAITLPRAVLEQALEALKSVQDHRPNDETNNAITALRAALAQQAEPVEPVAHRVVAGALFDFMGWLTSRRERLVLSSTDDAVPAADAIKDFAEMRGLSLDDAKVQDWNAALAQQAEPVEPPKPAPLKRGTTGRCTRKVCECEKEGLGPECIHLEPVIDGYPLWSGIPKAEPVEPVAWVGDPSTQDYASTVPDPQIEDHLARHGIPMPEGDPK